MEPIKVGDVVYLSPNSSDKLPDGTKVSRTYTVKAVNSRAITLDDESKWSVGRGGLTSESFKAYGQADSWTAPYIRRGQASYQAITHGEYRRILDEHNREVVSAQNQQRRDLIEQVGLTGAIIQTVTTDRSGWLRGNLRALRDANNEPEKWCSALEDALLTLGPRLTAIRSSLETISQHIAEIGNYEFVSSIPN